MPETAYVEVRCERCKTSFAPGTKRCIHCGAAIGRQLLAFDTRGISSAEAPDASQNQPGVPDAQPSIGRIFRIAMIALAVVAAIVRNCAESN